MIDEVIKFLSRAEVITGGVATLCAGLGYGAKKTYKVYKSARAALLDYKQGMASIKAIRQEVSPNGGASMKDQISLAVALVEKQQRQLQTLDARQRMLYHRLEVGILEFDASGQCVFVNRYLLMTAGELESDMLGYGWQSLVISERAEFVGEFDRAISAKSSMQYTGAGKNSLEITFNLRRVGEVFVAEVTFS